MTEVHRFGQELPWRRVVVVAADYWDAFDTAYAMAARPGYEVTGIYLRI